jgi:hypothetical protein
MFSTKGGGGQMTFEEALELHNGDEVYWNDPDEGLCSRYYTIQTITVRVDGLCVISDKQGTDLECWAEELS